MSYETLIDCGRELDNDIKFGLIDETGLLPSGRTKLQLWRESPAYEFSLLSATELEAMDCAAARLEEEYRATNKKPEDNDE